MSESFISIVEEYAGETIGEELKQQIVKDFTETTKGQEVKQEVKQEEEKDYDEQIQSAINETIALAKKLSRSDHSAVITVYKDHVDDMEKNHWIKSCLVVYQVLLGISRNPQFHNFKSLCQKMNLCYNVMIQNDLQKAERMIEDVRGVVEHIEKYISPLLKEGGQIVTQGQTLTLTNKNLEEVLDKITEKLVGLDQKDPEIADKEGSEVFSQVLEQIMPKQETAFNLLEIRQDKRKEAVGQMYQIMHLLARAKMISQIKRDLLISF
ncbi:MAG: hypothetical protein Dasosvirus3_26 [Dasosvirus sp.]|uniref:Uncharacterized protein n=1 Tax=Dasosvirus sp. TaxID=2487764 RepID=A0A3G4ZRF0_9VIRU|nr:MAG: hypothetical protein Dasosvirus3_26 [Dasosvirus sp.]